MNKSDPGRMLLDLLHYEGGSGDYVLVPVDLWKHFIGMGASLLVLFITCKEQACSLLFLEKAGGEVKGLTLGLS